MNVLELCLSAGLGGLELYVFRSSEALANSQSDKNTVLAVLRRDSKLDQYYKDHSDFDTRYIKHFFSPLPLINARRLAGIIDDNNQREVIDFVIPAVGTAESSQVRRWKATLTLPGLSLDSQHTGQGDARACKTGRQTQFTGQLPGQFTAYRA